MIIKGTYVGTIEKFKGEVALLRYGVGGELLAQFDNMRLKFRGVGYGFNWHKFDVSDFKIETIPEDGSECRLPKEKIGE